MIPATDYTDLASKLYALNVPCEMHLFGRGPHGVSLCDTAVKSKEEVEQYSMNYWTELCLKWLEQLEEKE